MVCQTPCTLCTRVNDKYSILSSSKFPYQFTKRSIWHPDMYQTHTAFAITSIWIRRTHKQRRNRNVWVDAEKLRPFVIEDEFFVICLMLISLLQKTRDLDAAVKKKKKKSWSKLTRLQDTTNIHTNIQHQSPSGRLVYSGLFFTILHF